MLNSSPVMCLRNVKQKKKIWQQTDTQWNTLSLLLQLLLQQLQQQLQLQQLITMTATTTTATVTTNYHITAITAITTTKTITTTTKTTLTTTASSSTTTTTTTKTTTLCLFVFPANFLHLLLPGGPLPLSLKYSIQRPGEALAMTRERQDKIWEVMGNPGRLASLLMTSPSGQPTDYWMTSPRRSYSSHY